MADLGVVPPIGSSGWIVSESSLRLSLPLELIEPITRTLEGLGFAFAR